MTGVRWVVLGFMFLMGIVIRRLVLDQFQNLSQESIRLLRFLHELVQC